MHTPVELISIGGELRTGSREYTADSLSYASAPPGLTTQFHRSECNATREDRESG